MPRLTFGDRLASGAVGAVVGAMVGLVLAWLLGVYSNTLGPATTTFGVVRFVLKVSATFAIIGLLIGPSVGLVLGNVITVIFAIEQGPQEIHLPRWLILVFAAAVVFATWWFFVR